MDKSSNRVLSQVFYESLECLSMVILEGAHSTVM